MAAISRGLDEVLLGLKESAASKFRGMYRRLEHYVITYPMYYWTEQISQGKLSEEQLISLTAIAYRAHMDHLMDEAGRVARMRTDTNFVTEPRKWTTELYAALYQYLDSHLQPSILQKGREKADAEMGRPINFRSLEKLYVA